MSWFWTQWAQPHKDLALAHLRKVLRQWLGEQDDIAVHQQLLTAAEASNVARQLPVRHAEPLTVATLKVNAPP